MLRKFYFPHTWKIFLTLGKFLATLGVGSIPLPGSIFFSFCINLWSWMAIKWLLTPSMTWILAGKLKSIQIAVHKSALKFINHVLVCSHHQSIVSSMTECSPFTPQARVQFPEGTIFLLIEGKLTAACLLQDKDLNVRTFQWLALQ